MARLKGCQDGRDFQRKGNENQLQCRHHYSVLRPGLAQELSNRLLCQTNLKHECILLDEEQEMWQAFIREREGMAQVSMEAR